MYGKSDLQDNIVSEAAALLEKAKRLSREEKVVLKYFLDGLSVGTIRAVEELKRKGIEDPERVINKLIELGFLEKGLESYSLSYPLRALISRRRIRIDI